jgi:hypothetical protein
MKYFFIFLLCLLSVVSADAQYLRHNQFTTNPATGYLVGSNKFVSPAASNQFTGPLYLDGGLNAPTGYVATLAVGTPDGSIWTNLNSTNLFGTIAPARLGSGGGGSTKFLREDSTFQTISSSGQPASSVLSNLSSMNLQPGQSFFVASNNVVQATNGLPNVGWFTNGPVTVVFEGESNTAGQGATTATNAFPGRLMALYFPTNFFWGTNAAVSGAQMASYQGNATNHLVYAMRPANGTNGILFFTGGLNDFSAGTTVASLFSSWSNYVVYAQGLGYKVCYINTIATAAFPIYEYKIRQFNDLTYDAHLVEWYYDANADIPGPPGGLWDDGSHLNNNGHLVAANSIANLLQKGVGNSWPIYPKSQSKVMGGKNTVRGGFPASVYSYASTGGLLLEVDGGGAGSFYGVTPTYVTTSPEEWYHSGSGNWSLTADLIRRIDTTKVIQFRDAYFGPVSAASNKVVITASNGNIAQAAGGTLSLTSGTNQRAGNATLVGGTVTVNNTTVTANTVVLLTRKTSGGTLGTAITYTVSAGTSFTITSDSALDTSTFSYMLIEVP